MGQLLTAQYVAFDDTTVLSAAQSDPGSFIDGLNNHVVLDEVQRVPRLLLTINKFVDQDKVCRRFNFNRPCRRHDISQDFRITSWYDISLRPFHFRTHKGH